MFLIFLIPPWSRILRNQSSSSIHLLVCWFLVFHCFVTSTQKEPAFLVAGISHGACLAKLLFSITLCLSASSSEVSSLPVEERVRAFDLGWSAVTLCIPYARLAGLQSLSFYCRRIIMLSLSKRSSSSFSSTSQVSLFTLKHFTLLFKWIWILSLFICYLLYVYCRLHRQLCPWRWATHFIRISSADPARTSIFWWRRPERAFIFQMEIASPARSKATASSFAVKLPTWKSLVNAFEWVVILCQLIVCCVINVLLFLKASVPVELVVDCFIEPINSIGESSLADSFSKTFGVILRFYPKIDGVNCQVNIRGQQDRIELLKQAVASLSRITQTHLVSQIFLSASYTLHNLSSIFLVKFSCFLNFI